MPFGFGSIIGLLGLLSLIPFIIMYFIRPKPREVVIPSLIFLGGSKEFRSKSGFLRRLISDKLLLLQIIILALISLFFSAPFLSSENISEGVVFLVLDTSASINDIELVRDGALNNLGNENTIITIGTKPFLVLDGGDSGEARDVIKRLKTKGTRSAIADGLSAARGFAEKISGERGIVVASDFIDTEEGDVKRELDLIRSADIPLKIINTADEKENVGIIDLRLRKSESEILIKNFCCGDKEIILKYGGKDEILNIAEGETKEHKFPTKNGKSILKLDLEDSINSDNEVYIVNEIDEKAEVLLISNGETKYLEAAMDASDLINYDVRNPSNAKEGYDVYILKDVGTFNSKLSGLLKKELKKGKSVVIIPEDGINGNYNGLLDFNIGNSVSGGDSSLVSAASFTDGLDFGRQGAVRKIDCDGECDVVYAKAEENPIVMIMPSESGLIGYYGVGEESGGFQNRPEYPVFWTRFVRHLAGIRDINGMNLKTGISLSFKDEVKYEKPSSSGKDKAIVMDEVGFYEIAGKSYSANLLSEKESNLFTEESVISDDEVINGKLEEDYVIKKDIWKWLLITAFILLLIEWVLINRKKRRSDYSV